MRNKRIGCCFTCIVIILITFLLNQHIYVYNNACDRYLSLKPSNLKGPFKIPQKREIPRVLFTNKEVKFRTHIPGCPNGLSSLYCNRWPFLEDFCLGFSVARCVMNILLFFYNISSLDPVYIIMMTISILVITWSKWIIQMIVYTKK